jgi:hypothetical protein
MRAYAGALEHEQIERLANPARAFRRQVQRQLSLNAPAFELEQHHAGCAQFHDSDVYDEFAMLVNATRARRREERRQVNPGPCCDDCAQSFPSDVPCDRNGCACESCAQIGSSQDSSMAPGERLALHQPRTVASPRISESDGEFSPWIAPELVGSIPVFPDVSPTRGVWQKWDEWFAKQRWSYIDCKATCKQGEWWEYNRCCADINGMYDCVSTWFNKEHCGHYCQPCGVNQKCLFGICFDACPCGRDEYCKFPGICSQSPPCTSDADCANLDSVGPLNCCPLTGTNRHCVDLDTQHHCGGCEPPSCANLPPPFERYCLAAGCCIGPGNLHFTTYNWKPNQLMQTNDVFCQCRDPLDTTWVMTYDPGGHVNCKCKPVGASCSIHTDCCTYSCLDGTCVVPISIPPIYWP